MFRLFIVVLLLIHGAIHLLGLVHAYQWWPLAMMTKPIARGTGIVWGIAAVLMVVPAILLLVHDRRWWMIAAVAVVVSQFLLIRQWHDARFGTIANVLVLLGVISGAASWSFHRRYAAAVSQALARTQLAPQRIIVDADLLALPTAVQRYLRASGVIGTKRPRSMRLTFTGQLRSESGSWMQITTEQVNSFEIPARFFWMNTTMKGVPVDGFHSYDNGVASMRIKLFGIFSIVEVGSVDSNGNSELDIAETVTWFNDLCLFAPGALLDSRITWQTVAAEAQHGEVEVIATFTDHRRSISARLVFDDHDRIVNFISDDRYLVAPPKTPVRRRFSTPATAHRMINGRLLPGHGDAIWQLPEGPFVYGQFNLTSITYDL